MSSTPSRALTTTMGASLRPRPPDEREAVHATQHQVDQHQVDVPRVHGLEGLLRAGGLDDVVPSSSSTSRSEARSPRRPPAPGPESCRPWSHRGPVPHRGAIGLARNVTRLQRSRTCARPRGHLPSWHGVRTPTRRRPDRCVVDAPVGGLRGDRRRDQRPVGRRASPWSRRPSTTVSARCRSEWAWRTTGGPPWTQGCWARFAGATRGRLGSGRSCGPPARPWPAGRSPRTSPPRSCRRTPATSTTPTQSPRRTAPSSGTRSSTGPSVGPRAAAWRGHPPRTRVVRAGRPPSAHPCARRGRLRRDGAIASVTVAIVEFESWEGNDQVEDEVPAARASRPRLQQPPGPRDRRPDRTLHREERGPHPGADEHDSRRQPSAGSTAQLTLRSGDRGPAPGGGRRSSPRPTRRGAMVGTTRRTRAVCPHLREQLPRRGARGAAHRRRRHQLERHGRRGRFVVGRSSEPAATSPWSWAGRPRHRRHRRSSLPSRKGVVAVPDTAVVDAGGLRVASAREPGVQGPVRRAGR